MSDETTKAGEAGLEETVPSFREAIDELEAILRRIEGEEVDIDQLAEQVARAGELADVCRTKLRKAELQVTEVVEKLEPGED